MTKASDAPHLFLKLNPESVAIIHSFIKQKMDESKADGAVIGLSGGLDSAVVTKLCADAMGPKKILALILPEKSTSEEDTWYAEGLPEIGYASILDKGRIKKTRYALNNVKWFSPRQNHEIIPPRRKRKKIEKSIIQQEMLSWRSENDI